jgi:predicted Abi (CAAX) family protease
LLKNILAYCGYSLTTPFFFLLFEHKHCDNAATNSNSGNARSRMVASLRVSVGMGTKVDESSTGRVWAAVFRHVMAVLAWRAFLNLRTVYFFNFPNFFSGHGQPWITETVDTVVHLYAHK